MLWNSEITSIGKLDSVCISAASFIDRPLLVADLRRKASPAPPIAAPLIAPHLKPSLAPKAPASMPSEKFPVSIPFISPADIPPKAAEERANVLAVLAD